MQIHIVQVGDTIDSIAESYGISASKLIQDNGVQNPNNLVVGQSLVIALPSQTYTVQEGDTLQDIADMYGITIMQLYQNNPNLYDREYLFPGETIIIRYDTKRKLTIHGNIFPFINMDTLRKSLPYLTYLSIINYTATTEGDIISYYDDTEIIATAKNYGVMPLMFLTTLTIQGRANIGIAYDILLNEEFQDRQIENIITILRTKGYYGINLSLQYINISSLKVYERYLEKIYTRLNQEGYFVFVSISPGITVVNNEIVIEQIDYTLINQISNNIIFMSYEWALNINPPSPIISVQNISIFLNYIDTIIPPDKLIIGIPTVGYDWQLPFVAGISTINMITMNNAIDLAIVVGAVIQFDEKSQTPYFVYNVNEGIGQVQHVVWFIDARSINSLLNLAYEYNLLGAAIWNIMIYNPQLFILIISQYEIEKITN